MVLRIRLFIFLVVELSSGSLLKQKEGTLETAIMIASARISIFNFPVFKLPPLYKILSLHDLFSFIPDFHHPTAHPVPNPFPEECNHRFYGFTRHT
jgi:hypothetical protein